MSAVLETVQSPVEAARAALDAAQADLAALDARIAGYQQEDEARDAERRAWRMADTQAVIANQPRPKAPRVKATDAETALPILKAKRPELAKRADDAEGKLRSATVRHVEQEFRTTQDRFAASAVQLIAAWAEMVGAHTLLTQAVPSTPALPPALLDDFSVPAFGTLRPLAPNHALHFLAAHSMALGEARRAMWAARREIEAEIGMPLPW